MEDRIYAAVEAMETERGEVSLAQQWRRQPFRQRGSNFTPPPILTLPIIYHSYICKFSAQFGSQRMHF